MRSRKGAAMYRVILKNTAYGEFNKELGKYDTCKAETRFDCKDLDQAMGLIELMVVTADALDFSIFKIEEDV